MKPLQSIGLGLVWLILSTPQEAVDWFADPVGWVLVLLGLRGLRAADGLERYRPTLWAVALVALAISVAFWLPAGSDWLTDAEPAVGWAADLPRFGFFAVLCHALVPAARESHDPRRVTAIGWLRTAETGLVAVMIAPVLVFGAGWSSLEGYTGLAAQILMLLLMMLCFVYAGRPWAGAAEAGAGREPRDGAV